MQNYLGYISFSNYVVFNTDDNDNVFSWKSIGFLLEKIINPYESDTNFSPVHKSSYVKIKGIFLKQKSVSFLHKNVVWNKISYNLDEWSKDWKIDFTPGNCLFGAVELTKNNDPDKYEYSGYSVGFDSCSQFSWEDGNSRKNIIIFGVDNSCSVHIDNRNEIILVLGEGSKKA